MRAILSDINIQGHVEVLTIILRGEPWKEFWDHLNLPVLTFQKLNTPARLSDAEVWRRCQAEQFVLITANRNDDGPDSLEATIRNENTADSLPVFTLADQERVLHS